MPTPRGIHRQRREAGLCTRCGQAPPLPDRCDCDRCHWLPVTSRCGVPLERALPPRDHEPMQHFLRMLVMAARRVPAGTTLNITGFIGAYREIYGLPHAEKQWATRREG